MSDVTQILLSLKSDSQCTSDELLPLVYDELRRLASQRLANEKPGQTLQATDLVHEAFVRLVGTDKQGTWDGRGHFFAAAAEAMRRILVESARRKKSLKRGGGRGRIGFDRIDVAMSETSVDILSLNEALEKLHRLDQVKSDLVKLRFFAGLTVKQAADSLGIGASTADKYWAYAKSWLRLEMDEQD